MSAEVLLETGEEKPQEKPAESSGKPAEKPPEQPAEETGQPAEAPQGKEA